MEPLAGNVEKIHRWCVEHGADLVLVVLPRAYQYSDREVPRDVDAGEYARLGPFCLEPFRFFDELRSRVDYPVLSLLEDFRQTSVFPVCFEDNSHWNPAGHQVAAQAIAKGIAPVVERRLSR